MLLVHGKQARRYAQSGSGSAGRPTGRPADQAGRQPGQADPIHRGRAIARLTPELFQ